MSQNYSLHFYLRKPRVYDGGDKFVYMRVSVGGNTPREASAGVMCDPKLWISSANRAKGNTESSKSLNALLDVLAKKIEAIYTDLLRNMDEVSADAIMDRYLGKAEKPKYLLEILEDHNTKMIAQIGNGFRANTLKGYKTTKIHLTGYLKKKYKSSDILIKKIDHEFITGYDFYLRTDKQISEISTAKYMKHLRKIINLCLAHRWIQYTPFAFYKNKAKPKDKEFLSNEDLMAMAEKEFSVKRLEQVRDIFLFSCHTGLSYADVKKLRRSEVRNGNDGKLWIFTSREKNEIASNIPVLPMAKKIMDKYKGHPECEVKGTVLPVLSNQKMNSYLKEIADLCGITKTLTFHIARHTFATTVTLSNGVPIETVSKMLGHLDIRTTQHYAKVLDSKVGNDMSALEEKLNEQDKKLGLSCAKPEVRIVKMYSAT